jgi:hypothetical protein
MIKKNQSYLVISCLLTKMQEVATIGNWVDPHCLDGFHNGII